MLKPPFKYFLFVTWIGYFIFGFFFISQSVYFLFPILFLLALFLFLKKQAQVNLLQSIQSLLQKLSTQMKLGLSFMSAWHKSVQEIESKEIQNLLLEITKILQFEKQFQHSNPAITNIVQDLIRIKKHPQPLKKLSLLERKIKVEQSFYRKTQQVLFQLRIQSTVITVLYLGLLSWTFAIYRFKHFSLMFISFICFILGLVWIFKMGKKMKWSL